MILHDAVIENRVINESVIDSTEEFIDKLLAATDLIADVYINTHKAFSSRVTMTVNNGYMMANVDGRFALSQAETIDSILIQVRQSGDSTIILSSFTMFGEMMDTGDYDADLYFKVINVVPNCTLKCFISDSKFKSLRTAKLPPIALYEQPVAPGYEVGPAAIAYYNATVDGGVFYIENVEFDPEVNYSWVVSTDTASCTRSKGGVARLDIEGGEYGEEDAKSVLNSIISGKTPKITISVEDTGNLVVSNVEASVKYTATAVLDANEFSFRVSLLENGETVQCDSETEYCWTMGFVGGGKESPKIGTSTNGKTSLMLNINNLGSDFSEVYDTIIGGNHDMSVEIVGEGFYAGYVPVTVNVVNVQ